MTEKEKMIAGKVYNCLDEELSTALRKAKQLCHKYNDIFFEDEAAVKKIIDELCRQSIMTATAYLLRRFGVTTDLM